MSTVQCIITFNGGSAGDLLKTVCLEQISNFNNYHIDATGKIYMSHRDNYFKELCRTEQRYKQKQLVDFTQCFPIENSHSYHDWFRDITSNLFYIYYHDLATPMIVETFINKRKGEDFNKWLQEILPTHIPSALQSRVTQHNLIDVLGIFWKKNMHNWQANAALTPIPMTDLFELTALSQWVERLCNQPLSNPAQLAKTHRAWLAKNSNLVSALL